MNPVPDVRRPTRGRSRSRILSEAEEAILHAALDSPGRDEDGRFRAATRNPWVRPLVQFAILTAMRRGELLALEWRYVDVEGRAATLPITKNGDTRTVPLSTAALNVLEGLGRVPGEARVFPTSGMVLRKTFERACEWYGIDDQTLRQLHLEASLSYAPASPGRQAYRQQGGPHRLSPSGHFPHHGIRDE